MAIWKKLIFSGSDAQLNNLYVTNAITASFFSGNGAAITGIVTASFATSASWAPTAASSPIIQTFDQWTNDQDNLSINSTTTILRVSGDGGIRALTSINASGMTDGREIKLINTGSQPIIIQAQHPDATSGYSFGILQDSILPPNGMCSIVRDGTSNVFRLINGSSTAQRLFGRSVVAGSVTAGDWGEIAFNVDFGSVTSFAPSASIPAGFITSTGANSAGNGYISAAKTVNGLFTAGSVYAYYKTVVTIPVLSDSSQGFYAMYGFFSQLIPNTSFTNSVIIVYSHLENSGRWTAYAAPGSGATSLDLGVTVSTETLYTLEIYLNKQLNEARFFINGIYRGRLTTNLPVSGTSFNPQAGISKIVGSTARTARVHQIDFWGLYSN